MPTAASPRPPVHRLLRLALLLAAASLLVPRAGAQILETDEFEIVYRLEAGQRLRYDCTSLHHTESRLGQLSNTQIQEEVETRLLEVLEASGGTFRVRVLYERYRRQQRFLIGEKANPAAPNFKFDSAGLTPEELHEAARKNQMLETPLKFLGKSYVIRFTKHGEIRRLHFLQGR